MFDDGEQKRQMQESMQMHKCLGNSPLGGFLSTFMAQASVYRATSGGPTAFESVMSNSKALVGALSSKRAREKTGLETKDGSLPKFIFIADIHGRRFAFHSKYCTLIREMCACFYGHADAMYGHASYLRRSIEVQAAEIEGTGASCALVLVVPWAKALEDRAWRLFSIEEKINPNTNEIGILDSEICLTNAQTPPSPPGSSVNGRPGEHAFPSSEMIQAFCNTYSAIDLDVDMASSTKQPSTSEQSSEESRVLRQLLEKLRADNQRLDERAREADAAKERMEEEFKLFEKEKRVLYGDIEQLHSALEKQAGEVDKERTATDSLTKEVAELEEALASARGVVLKKSNEIQELRGDLLVAEEAKNKQAKRDKAFQNAMSSLKELKKKESETSSHFAEALEKIEHDKKLFESEINDLKQQLSRQSTALRLKSSMFEVMETERNKLSADVERLQSSSSQSRQTSSETISKLIDSTQKLESEKTSLENKLQLAKTSVLSLCARNVQGDIRHRRLITKLAARLFESKLMIHLFAIRNSECASDEQAEQTAATNEQTDRAPRYQAHYPADEIAAVSRCISVLQNFKDLVTNSDYSSHNQQYNYTMVYSPHQEYYMNGNCDYSQQHAQHPQHSQHAQHPHHSHHQGHYPLSPPQMYGYESHSPSTPPPMTHYPKFRKR
jgi:hypothetical protein